MGVREEAGLGAWDRRVAVTVAAVVVAGVAWSWAAPLVGLVLRSTDDSYYYYNVARHIVLGQGPTFDGINPTNGFHPLWMACLLPLFALTHADPVTSLRAAYTLMSLLAGLAAWFTWRAASSSAGPAAGGLAMLILALPVFFAPLTNGLETSLLVVLLFLLVVVSQRFDFLGPRPGPRRDLTLGLLLGLVFLARLDSVFVLMAVFGTIAWRGWRGGPEARAALPGRLLRVALPIVALSLPYFAWNFLSFGHLEPISGALKSSFPHPGFYLRSRLNYGFFAGVAEFVVAGVALLVLHRLEWTREPGRKSRVRVPDILAPMWAGAGLHLLHTLVFIRWGAQWWHFSLYGPATILLIPLSLVVLVERWPRLRAAVPLAFGGLVLLLTLGHGLDLSMRGNEHRDWLEAARWADRNLPRDAVVGMRECGLFGYFCGRPTVNLDGVINGYRYQAALARHAFSRYLADCGVTYIADVRARYQDGRCVLRMPAYLARGAGAAIVTQPSAEIYSTRQIPVGANVTPNGRTQAYSLAIWDISRVSVVDDASRLP